MAGMSEREDKAAWLRSLGGEGVPDDVLEVEDILYACGWENVTSGQRAKCEEVAAWARSRHDPVRTAALALSRAIEPADLPPEARPLLLLLRVALGPESVVVEDDDAEAP
jgi:hypothetical protein